VSKLRDFVPLWRKKTFRSGLNVTSKGPLLGAFAFLLGGILDNPGVILRF
jgi:hypothetical protein